MSDLESPEAFTSRLICNAHDYDAALPLIRARDAAVRRAALMEQREDAGWFVLEEDEDGQRVWRGSSGPDAKDESVLYVLTLATDAWPVGTRIVATVPTLAAEGSKGEWRSILVADECERLRVMLREAEDALLEAQKERDTLQDKLDVYEPPARPRKYV